MKRKQRLWVHILLFVFTLATTTYAGIGFGSPAAGMFMSFEDVLANIPTGLQFSLPLLLFLTAHEFGHYLTARRYGVDATLPYYIPMPLFFFGTMGAVIRIRSAIPSRRALFDIGVAGPIAGFVVAFVFLVIGMLTGPGIEQIYHVHPELSHAQTLRTDGLHFGGFLLMDLMKSVVVPSGAFFPPMNEIYHYPLLCVGWFGMFVTALNMLPVGQLDGGHVIYSMFGSRQRTISKWVVRGLIVIGVGGVLGLVLESLRAGWQGGLYEFLNGTLRGPLEWIDAYAPVLLIGWPGWLFWVLIIKLLVRVEHPPVADETPLDKRRMIVGWCALAMFVLTFSWTGLYERTPFSPGRPEKTMQVPGNEVVVDVLPARIGSTPR